MLKDLSYKKIKLYKGAYFPISCCKIFHSAVFWPLCLSVLIMVSFAKKMVFIKILDKNT